MLTGDEPKPHIVQRQVDRVSSAFWPVQIRKGVATNYAAQRRRDWIMQRRWWMLLTNMLSWNMCRTIVNFLIISTSLLVAVLGLHFWYLLLLPLLFLTLLLLASRFLARYTTQEMAQPTPFAQDMRSSAGFLAPRARELSNSAELHSYRLSSALGLSTGDAPTTPISIDAPLVRVLETYDVRTTPARHFLAYFPEDTAEQTRLRSITQDFLSDAMRDMLQGQELPCSQEGVTSPLDLPKSRHISASQDTGYSCPESSI